MNIVKELRKRKGIQQKELALIIGVAQPTVSEWELNKKDPSGERLKKLADYFGVDELVILGKGVIDLNPEIDFVASGKPITDEIRRDLLAKLGYVPRKSEITIVSGMMEKMSKEQQEQVVNVVRAMFANHPEILDN